MLIRLCMILSLIRTWGSYRRRIAFSIWGVWHCHWRFRCMRIYGAGRCEPCRRSWKRSWMMAQGKGTSQLSSRYSPTPQAFCIAGSCPTRSWRGQPPSWGQAYRRQHGDQGCRNAQIGKSSKFREWTCWGTRSRRALRLFAETYSSIWTIMFICTTTKIGNVDQALKTVD